jgi:hypothetical protein
MPKARMRKSKGRRKVNIAQQGRLYWSNRGTSRGKRSPVRYGQHGKGGDFYQCVRHMRKYVRNPKGYCAKRHKEATGKWPGRRRRSRGKRR